MVCFYILSCATFRWHNHGIYRIYGTNAIAVVIGVAVRVEQVGIVQAGVRILQVEVRIAGVVADTARRQPQSQTKNNVQTYNLALIRILSKFKLFYNH